MGVNAAAICSIANSAMLVDRTADGRMISGVLLALRTRSPCAMHLATMIVVLAGDILDVKGILEQLKKEDNFLNAI